MMNRLIAILLCGLAVGVASRGVFSQGGAAVIKMTVTKVGFEPAQITVEKGQPVVLKITATDRDHGIVIPDLGVPATRLPKGEEVEVKFTPEKQGAYRFQCSVLCGWRHPLGWVSGTIIVK